MKRFNPWLYAKISKERLVNNPYLKGSDIDTAKSEQAQVVNVYEIISNYNYLATIRKLDDLCRKDTRRLQPKMNLINGEKYRPYTIKELIGKRVRYFNNHDQKSSPTYPFSDDLSTSSGILYSGGTGKFKLIQLCDALLDPRNFNKDKQSIDMLYHTLDGTVLDIRKGKYNQPLSMKEVLEHPGWIAAVEGDRDLLKDYAAIVFAELAKRLNRNDITSMMFRVGKCVSQDRLRPLCLTNLIQRFDYPPRKDFCGIDGLARIDVNTRLLRLYEGTKK